MTSVLYGLSYSPWTERARWALDHHAVPYRFRAHVPFLGEALLRLRTGRLTGPRATVPLLVTAGGGEKIGDSLDIIAYADRVGAGSRLIIDRAEAERFRDRIEVGLQAVRARVTANILADPAALRESSLAVSPEFAAGALRPIAALAARYLARKYGADLRDDAGHERTIAAVAEELRAARKEGRVLGGPSLSAIDLMAATFLQGIRPPDAPHLGMGPAVRAAWGCERLAREYADLLAWRDELYATQRFGVGDRTASA